MDGHQKAGVRDEARRGRGSDRNGAVVRENENEVVDASAGKGGKQRRGRSSEGAERRRGQESIDNKKTAAADEEEEEEESQSESEHDSESSQEVSWIQWFCSLQGNEFFTDVAEDFVQDEFNLTGLGSQVPYYDYALDIILDIETPPDEVLSEEQQELVESAAEILYGLIHARYILTQRGMQQMVEKFKKLEFGRCPRVMCEGQAVLPVGQSDQPQKHTVKVYCPRCGEIFYPRSSKNRATDGAYFGTSFPHLLIMGFPDLAPAPAPSYVPRIFGFKLHSDAFPHVPQRKIKGSKTRDNPSAQLDSSKS